MPDTAQAPVNQRVAPPPMAARAPQPEAKRPANDHGGVYTRFQELAAGSGGEPPPAEKVGPLLQRAEFAHPANDLQRARVVSSLQERYGNRYVQTVLAGQTPDERGHGGNGNGHGRGLIQRAAADGAGGTTAAPAGIGGGGGQSLDTGARASMERSFGQDFSSVRVHTGPEASAAASGLGAQAFTTGRDIYFSQGAYNPASTAGRGLIAHELAHVVQQSRAPATTVQQSPAPDGRAAQGYTVSRPGDAHEREARAASSAVLTGGPLPSLSPAPAGGILQGYTVSQPGDAHEREARAASTAVLTGSPVPPLSPAPAGGTHLQRGILDRIGSGIRSVGSAIASGARAVGGAIADVAGDVIGAAVNYIREHARSIPGYDLLGFILGRDPISQEPVERNATNLLRGVLGLIPGGIGLTLFQNLEQAHVIERAFEWVTTELARLNITWSRIRGAIDQFLSTLGPADIFRLGSVLQRAIDIFGPILDSIRTFAVEAGKKILEFIFEGALALAGGAGQRVLAIFRKIQATFSLIVADPVGFLRNLLNAVLGGFRQFAANILTHLRTAIFDWLFGALQGAGLQLPAHFDLMGILSIVLQILGLTYARLRERLVRMIGERPVAMLEQGFEFLRILVTQGLAAAWQKVLEYVGNLRDMVIEGIKSWIQSTIIGQAIQQLAGLLTPVGAVIQAIIKIYNTVMFFIERAQQIAALVESVVDSISNIAQGNIAAASSYVERTLARILPLVISFLARFIGLGGISERIKDIVKRIHAAVDRAIDRVVDWIKTQASRLLGRRDAEPDNRTPEQKEQALNAALDELDLILHGEHPSLAVGRQRLPEIRDRHRLTRLEIVVESHDDSRDVVHVEGEINPKKKKPAVAIITTPVQLPINLDQHEDVVGSGQGHSKAKHVGKLVPFLRNRLKTEPNIPAATTFRDLGEANNAVTHVFTVKSSEIQAMLASNKKDEVFKVGPSPFVLEGVRRPANNPQDPATIDQEPLTPTFHGVRVVLRKNPGAPNGWYIVTSHPDD